MSAVLAFLRGLPWQLWAALALCAALWAYGHARYNAGQADCREAHAAAVAAAEAAQREAERERDRIAADIAETARQQANAASADIRATAAVATERVVTVMRTVEVPMGCPTELPAVVDAELQAAVERANRR